MNKQKLQACIASPLILLGGGNVKGQDFTKVMDFGRPAKNYHTVVDEVDNFYYMAGTYQFTPVNPNLSQLHFMQLGLAGNLVNSVTYDVPNHDERCVAFLDYPLDNAKIIVALLRDNAALTPTPKERIKILEVKNNGAIMKDFVVEKTGNTGYNQIYPMDALVDNNFLYVCGFVSTVASPSQPDFFINTPPGNNTKEAFVMKFDLDQGAVVQFVTYDFSPASLNADFDMAMRLKLISVGGINQLFVTGSCNVENTLGIVTQYGAGTMNLLVDMNNLSVVTSQPFSFGVANNVLTTTLEYGLDIQPDPGGTGFYILGNSGYAARANTEGFGAYPVRTWLTYVSSSLAITPNVNNRLKLTEGDNLWGVHLMPSKLGTEYTTIAGYYTYENRTFFPQPGLSNINPFLATVKLGNDGNGGNSSILLDFRVYLSRLGTLPFGNPTSFWDLGGGLSTPVWQPRFAARRKPGTTLVDDIFMYAPVKSFLGNYLTTKTIRTNPDGDVFVCPNTYGFTEPMQLVEPATDCSNCFVTPTLYATNITPNYVSVPAALPLVAEDDCSNDIYRTLPTLEFAESATNYAVSVSPNPATAQFSLLLNQTVTPETNVRIALLDVYGRSIRTIYDGSGERIRPQGLVVDVSDIPSGLYQIQATIGHQVLNPVKLIKN